jgi:MFS family permease
LTTSAQATARQSKWAPVLRVTAGNSLEMYDFQIFGYYAVAIGATFFPSQNPFASLMLSLATFGAGFLMRPLGAVVLGAYIDHHGRRKGLLLTLGLMAIGTLSIAVLPGYAAIGLAAPLLVLAGRLLQGLSAGVELGGVSVYLAEIATPGRKGFYVSWQSASQQVAVMFAALIGLVLAVNLSPNQMASWGWRVPLLAGCSLIPVLLFLRKSLEETSEFLARRRRPSTSQIVGTLFRNWPVVLMGMMMATMTTVCFRRHRPSPRPQHQPDRHSVRRGLQFSGAAAFRSFVRSHRPAAHSDCLHRSSSAHGVSWARVAGKRAFFYAAAHSGVVAGVSLCFLQWRHGRLPDGNHAGRGAHFRLLPSL